MNDILLDPPAPTPPQPQKATNLRQFGLVMFLIAAVALLLGILIASNRKSSTPTITTTTVPVTVTEAPTLNKYDQFLEHMYNNSGTANTTSKADLISYGNIVCGALDQGRSIRFIVNYLSNRSTGRADNELYAALIYGSITYLCPEYTGDLHLYLNGGN